MWVQFRCVLNYVCNLTGGFSLDVFLIMFVIWYAESCGRLTDSIYFVSDCVPVKPLKPMTTSPLTPGVLVYWLNYGIITAIIQVHCTPANWFRISIPWYSPGIKYCRQNNTNCFWSIYCKFDILHGHWAFCLIYSVKDHQPTETRGWAGNKTRIPQRTGNVLDASLINGIHPVSMVATLSPPETNSKDWPHKKKG